jgi:hypothetical protein
MSEETKVFFKNEGLVEDEIFKGYSKRVICCGEEEDYRSYESNCIYITVKNDGALCLSGDAIESFIYFYPD